MTAFSRSSCAARRSSSAVWYASCCVSCSLLNCWTRFRSRASCALTRFRINRRSRLRSRSASAAVSSWRRDAVGKQSPVRRFRGPWCLQAAGGASVGGAPVRRWRTQAAARLPYLRGPTHRLKLLRPQKVRPQREAVDSLFVHLPRPLSAAVVRPSPVRGHCECRLLAEMLQSRLLVCQTSWRLEAEGHLSTTGHCKQRGARHRHRYRRRHSHKGGVSMRRTLTRACFDEGKRRLGAILVPHCGATLFVKQCDAGLPALSGSLSALSAFIS